MSDVPGFFLLLSASAYCLLPLPPVFSLRLKTWTTLP